MLLTNAIHNCMTLGRLTVPGNQRDISSSEIPLYLFCPVSIQAFTFWRKNATHTHQSMDSRNRLDKNRRTSSTQHMPFHIRLKDVRFTHRLKNIHLVLHFYKTSRTVSSFYAQSRNPVTTHLSRNLHGNEFSYSCSSLNRARNVVSAIPSGFQPVSDIVALALMYPIQAADARASR
jgi:hypothetical protein